MNKYQKIFSIVVLSGAAAVGASAQVSYVITAAGDKAPGVDLLRIESDKIAKEDNLGYKVIYGAANGRVATVSEATEQEQLGFRLSIWDVKSGERIKSHFLKGARVLTYMQGPQDQVVLGPDGKTAYCLASDESSESARIVLLGIDVETGKVESHPVPSSGETSAGRLIVLPDGVGAVEGDGSLAEFSTQSGDFKTTLSGAKAGTQYLYVDGGGLIRWDRSRSIQRASEFTAAHADFEPLSTLKHEPAGAQAISVKGKPAIAYGVKTDAGISAIAAYDLAARKEAWRQSLPGKAAVFSVSKDGALIRFVDAEKKEFVTFDRSKKTVANRVKIPLDSPADLAVIPVD